MRADSQVPRVFAREPVSTTINARARLPPPPPPPPLLSFPLHLRSAARLAITCHFHPLRSPRNERVPLIRSFFSSSLSIENYTRGVKLRGKKKIERRLLGERIAVNDVPFTFFLLFREGGYVKNVE